MKRKILALLMIWLIVAMVMAPVFATTGPGIDVGAGDPLSPWLYLAKSMLPVVAVLAGLGKLLKEAAFLANNRIPIVLLLLGIILGIAVIGFTQGFNGPGILAGTLQGALAAIAATGIHQQIKQYLDAKNEDKNRRRLN